MNNYKRAQREFDDWLRTDAGLSMSRATERRLTTDESGWDHYAYRLTLKTTRNGERIAETFDYRAGIAHDKAPTIGELVAALISDATCVHHRTFEEFAGELGYDSDSRSALATYEQIEVNNAKLVTVFGMPLADILRRTESMIEAAGL